MTELTDRATTIAGPPRTADRLYHDMLAPAEIVELRTRARETASAVVAPVAARISRQDERVDGFPHEVFQELADAGLFRIPFAADVDGDGLAYPATATATTVEELAHYSNSVAAVFDVHCILAGNAVAQGTPEQREQWLRPLVAGELVGSFATSEPGAPPTSHRRQ